METLIDAERAFLAKFNGYLVPQASDKETAKLWANALGLKTWRYVRL